MTTQTMLNTATVPIPVTSGGTNFATATTAYAPVCTGTTATGTFQVASTGLSSNGYTLTSNGSSSLPSFQSVGMSKIATATASNSASITFTTMTGYTNYLILANNITPATNDAMISIRFSNNGGSSYSSGGTDYRSNWFNVFSTTSAAIGNTTGSYIEVSRGLSNTAGTAAGFTMYIYNPSGSEYTSIWAENFLIDNASNFAMVSAGGQCTAITANNAIQILMSSGNISTGTFQLYGIQ